MEENYRQVKARVRTLEAEAGRLRRQELQIILVDMRQKIKEIRDTHAPAYRRTVSFP